MEPPRYRFTIDQYHQLAEAGILDCDERLELLDGIIMTMHPTTRWLFTVQDLHRMVESEVIPRTQRIEVVEGELVDMPPPSGNHHHAVERVAAFLTEVISKEAHAKTQVTTRMPISFNERTEFQPDILLLNKRFNIETAVPTPSDISLLIEVANEDTLNYIRRFKMPFYARAAWVVNMVRDCLEVRTFANPAHGTYEFIERRGHGGPAMYMQMVADVRVKAADLLAAARG